MTGQIPPVLYSADFSGCAAIPHLLPRRKSPRSSALVLRSAGRRSCTPTATPTARQPSPARVVDGVPHAVLHTWTGYSSRQHRHLQLFLAAEGARGHREPAVAARGAETPPSEKCAGRRTGMMPCLLNCTRTGARFTDCDRAVVVAIQHTLRGTHMSMNGAKSNGFV